MTRTRSSNKSFTKLIRAAVRQGWTHDRTGKGHHRLRSPDGDVVYMSCSPRDEDECAKKILTRLQKFGFKR
ncbi:MAG: hypothetical protein V3U98_08815 [Acidobacteriota bacterium]